MGVWTDDQAQSDTLHTPFNSILTKNNAGASVLTAVITTTERVPPVHENDLDGRRLYLLPKHIPTAGCGSRERSLNSSRFHPCIPEPWLDPATPASSDCYKNTWFILHVMFSISKYVGVCLHILCKVPEDRGCRISELPAVLFLHGCAEEKLNGTSAGKALACWSMRHFQVSVELSGSKAVSLKCEGMGWI